MGFQHNQKDLNNLGIENDIILFSFDISLKENRKAFNYDINFISNNLE